MWLSQWNLFLRVFKPRSLDGYVSFKQVYFSDVEVLQTYWKMVTLVDIQEFLLDLLFSFPGFLQVLFQMLGFFGPAKPNHCHEGTGPWLQTHNHFLGQRSAIYDTKARTKYNSVRNQMYFFKKSENKISLDRMLESSVCQGNGWQTFFLWD